MGMYDTINGEQVKCFYWTNYYNPDEQSEGCHLCTSGGNLYYFNDGSKVPFKNDAYNYTENFLIFDAHFRSDTYRCPACSSEFYNGEEFCSECNTKLEKCPAVVHIIRDGKVQESIYLYEKIKKNASQLEKMNHKLFSNNNKVISYYGDVMNIHSVSEMFEYSDVLKRYMDYVEENAKRTIPLRQQIEEERRKKEEDYSKEKFHQLVEEYGKAVDENTEKLEVFREKYMNRFFVSDSMEETLGQYLEILYSYNGLEDKDKEYKMARREFLEFYKEENLQSYFSYINATPQEQEDIKILIEQYQKEENA